MRAPSLPVSSSDACVTKRNGSVSAIGEALAMFPASVPAFLICGEPKRSMISAIDGTSSRMAASNRASETRPPAMSVSPSTVMSDRPSTASSDRMALGVKLRFVRQTPKSVAPWTITVSGCSRLNAIAYVERRAA